MDTAESDSGGGVNDTADSSSGVLLIPTEIIR